MNQIILLWALVTIQFLSACTSSKNISQQTVIQINEQKMSAKEFAEHLARRLKKHDSLTAKDPGTVSRAKEAILTDFVMSAISSNYAKAQQIVVTPDELEKEINLVRSTYPDDLSFRRVLALEGTSLSEWRSELEKTLLQKKIMRSLSDKNSKPSGEEVKKAYEESRDRFKKKERIYLRQIILDDLSKAQAVRDEVKKKDFSELAKKYSVAPEGKSGGLIGWVEKGTVDIFDKAFALPVGGISSVLESIYGFHIFKVERKAGPGYATLDEVKAILEQEVMGRREQGEFANWLDKQIRATRVLRNNDLVKAISVETRGL